MLISVIVPFLNASRTLPYCLDGLAAQNYRTFEIVFVDNGSTDESAAQIRKFQSDHPALKVALMEESRRSAAAARNTGARAAQGEWIAFTDADCVPDAYWLADLAAAAGRHPQAAAFAGTIIPAPSAELIPSFLGLFTLPAIHREQVYERYTLVSGGFPTANFMVRKPVFEQAGGFDPDIEIYGEDHDLCLRLYQTGGRIQSLTSASVRHIHRNSLEGLVKQSFGFGRSHALMLKKLPGGAFLLLAPGLRLVKSGLGLPVRVWLDLNQADKKFLLAVLLGLVWLPLSLLVPAYLVYLYASIYRRARDRRAVPCTPQSVFAYEGLLLLKSASMTLGRMYGSLKHRVFCL